MSKALMTDRLNEIAASAEVERIHADHVTVKRLGNWTRADRYEIRARSGSVMLDLRSPHLPAEVEIRLRLDRAVVKLLLPDGATVEHWDLAWTGRGKIKDAQAATPSEQQHEQQFDEQHEQQHEEQPREEEREEQGQVQHQPTGGVRRVRLVGTADGGEVRINRGGIAMLAAMCSREYVEELRQAREAGTYPTIDDPTRPPKTAA